MSPWSLARSVLAPRLRGVVGGALLGALATACGAGLLSLAAWLLATALPAAGGATPAWAPAWDALQVARLGRLDRALGDLQAQVSPGLVLDELRLGCPAENRIS